MTDKFADMQPEDIAKILAEPLLEEMDSKLSTKIDAKVDTKVAAAVAVAKSEITATVQETVLEWLKTHAAVSTPPKRQFDPTTVAAGLTRAKTLPGSLADRIENMKRSNGSVKPGAAKKSKPQSEDSDSETGDEETMEIRVEAAASGPFTLLCGQIRIYFAQIKPHLRDSRMHILGQAYGKVKSQGRVRRTGVQARVLSKLADHFKTLIPNLTADELNAITATNYDPTPGNIFKFSLNMNIK